MQTLHLRYPDEQFGQREGSINRLPVDWQHYTSLEKIMIPLFEPWETFQLPDWFADLQRLTRLDLPGSAVLNFYVCWPCLSQMHHLDLRSYDSSIKKDVLLFAQMPHLTYLSFADLGPDAWNGTGVPEDPEEETIRNLNLLAKALKRSRVQPSRLFRISVRRFWYEWQAKVVIGLPGL